MSSFGLSRRKSAFGKSFPINQRVASSTTSYCRVVHWHYTKQNFGVSSNVRGPFYDGVVFDATESVIEDAIVSLKINKELGKPSATFDLTLLPTDNWKKRMSPGDWLGIYLYNRQETGLDDAIFDTKNMVLLGNIDRVSRSLQRNEDDDKVQLRYNVSGRNFGKVLEETDIWFDPYAIQKNVADVMLQQAGIPLQGSPDEIVQSVLDVFLGKGITTASGGRTTSLNQWRLPTALTAMVGEGFGTNLYDILDINLEKGLPGYRGRVMLGGVGDSSNIWQQIQRGSNKLINEVIVEEGRGEDGIVKPTIRLRPRPLNTVFFDSQFGSEKAKLKGQLKGHYTTLQDLADEDYLEISPKEIVYENLGKDDHSRMNLFYLRSDTNFDHLQTVHTNMNKKSGVGIPFILRESIERHGLKRFEGQIDFPFANKLVKEASGDSDLFKAFLVQLYDMNYANHLYDQGTIECTGVLEAELGKCLVVKAADPANDWDKIYYIEGYEHEWKFPGTWRTVFTVTKGQFLAAGINVFIDVDDDDFGSPDGSIGTTYLAKTRTQR